MAVMIGAFGLGGVVALAVARRAATPLARSRVAALGSRL
jgi:hypothetical protein